MDDLDSEWRRKGATLSHKTAQKEFGLTWDEIVRALRAGKLHCQQQSMHGNPWLRLLRREVEALVKEKNGANYLRDRQAKTELARINRELKRLKGQIAALEAEVQADRWRSTPCQSPTRWLRPGLRTAAILHTVSGRLSAPRDGTNRPRARLVLQSSSH